MSTSTELPWQCHDAYFLCAHPTAPEALLIPAAQPAPRLVAQPAPRHLDGHRPEVPAPRLADPLLSACLSALVRCRCEARGRPHLLPIPKLPPAEEFVDVHPRSTRPDRPQAQQLADFLDRRAAVVRDRPLALPFQLDDLPVQELRVLPFPLPSGRF
jgi:hypothetical protein